MSFATLEREIVSELRIITKRPKLRKKDLLAWSTGPVDVGEGEIVVDIPNLGITAVIPAK